MRQPLFLPLCVLFLVSPRRAEPSPSSAPVAIVYQLAGEAFRTDPGQPRRPVHLFDRLPAGAVLDLASDARLSLAFASGKRWTAGAGARIAIGTTDLASRSGAVRPLPTVSPFPLLPPIRKEDRPGPHPGAVRIRGERIAGLYPGRGATALADATVLRFKAVDEKGTYRVEIQDRQGAAVVSLNTTEPAVKIPAETLRPGTAYHWIVSTVDRPGPAAKGEADFTTLDAASARRREILRTSLKRPEDMALLAGVDRQLGLLAEAREELASALTANPDQPALRAALADLDRELAGEGADTRESGFVIEKVTPRSLGALAGFRPGDVLLSWCRRPAAEGERCLAEGKLNRAFDLADLETEQVPRGGVRVLGKRGGEDAGWDLLPGPLQVEARPVLAAALEQLDQEARGFTKAGDFDAAAERWRSAAARAGEGGRQLSLWFLRRAGDAFAATGKPALADHFFQDALAIIQDPALEARLLLDWGAILQRRRDWTRARECYVRGLAVSRTLGPDSLMTAQLLHNLGVLSDDRGDQAQAQSSLEEALAIREKLSPRSYKVSESLNALGIAASRGDPEKAESLYRQGLELDGALAPENLECVRNLLSSSTLAIRQGDLETGDKRLRRAKAILEEAAPDGGDLGLALNGLAVIAKVRGDLEAAGALFRRSLDISEAIDPLGPLTAGLLQNLGALSAEQEDFGAAERYTRRALAVHRELNPEGLGVGMDLMNLGHLEASHGDPRAAQNDFRSALGIWEKSSPESASVAEILRGLGTASGNLGDLTAAEGYFRRSIALLEKLAPGTEDLATSLYDLGRVYRLRGQERLAAPFFCRAVETLEKQRSRLGEVDRSTFGGQAGDYYAACLGAHLKTGDKAEAFRVLELGRARAFLEQLADRDLLASAELPPELADRRRDLDAAYDAVQAALAKTTLQNDKPKLDELQARKQEIRAQQAELAATIRHRSPRYAALHDPLTIDLAGARQALDPGTVLLAYAVDEDKTYLLVVEPATVKGSGLTALTLPVRGKDLRTAVRSFRNLLQNQGSDRSALTAQATRLYDLLVRPAERQISGARRLLISADGPLHTLPFAALVRTQGGKPRYLIEWKPVHSVLSATVYAEIRKARRPPGDPSQLQLVAFGDPVYPKLHQDPDSPPTAGPEVLTAVRRGLSLEPLPATRAEVNELVSLFPHSQTYLGPEATEEQAKRTAPGAGLLHFACHGLLDERSPLDSALALSLPEHPKQGQDNGLLQAWEIAELHLDADLVTLSACDTALGQDMGSEGLVGLTRAFQIAGARSVVASLWSVADTSTSELMKRFYGYLRQGKAKDEALRQAQADLIHSAALSHPYHWAAFQLSGDWQ